ncbi:hypothetical protein TrispH2_008187 [Trichoplax sp. H2]|nr:hypothetical protein TrispH2_008187 [Trichoplax sp. H2]|eukprot:RDD38779.1 hypothetical protein TrispH2_008187 [Trichoplax sp. H2]
MGDQRNVVPEQVEIGEPTPENVSLLKKFLKQHIKIFKATYKLTWSEQVKISSGCRSWLFYDCSSPWARGNRRANTWKRIASKAIWKITWSKQYSLGEQKSESTWKRIASKAIWKITWSEQVKISSGCRSWLFYDCSSPWASGNRRANTWKRVASKAKWKITWSEQEEISSSCRSWLFRDCSSPWASRNRRANTWKRVASKAIWKDSLERTGEDYISSGYWN